MRSGEMVYLESALLVGTAESIWNDSEAQINLSR